MLIINALLIAACAHAAEIATASTFRPWALNDSTAFMFPRIAEKRNRVRRERLRADGAALAAKAEVQEPHVYVAAAIRKGAIASPGRLEEPQVVRRARAAAQLRGADVADAPPRH